MSVPAFSAPRCGLSTRHSGATASFWSAATRRSFSKSGDKSPHSKEQIRVAPVKKSRRSTRNSQSPTPNS